MYTHTHVPSMHALTNICNVCMLYNVPIAIFAQAYCALLFPIIQDSHQDARVAVLEVWTPCKHKHLQDRGYGVPTGGALWQVVLLQVL